ncbi:MAG TPA: hypothetical protein VJ183_02795 [Chloroflexia bacterium]|nr:hypothetical protein [Chloroflexia bacterium]
MDIALAPTGCGRSLHTHHNCCSLLGRYSSRLARPGHVVWLATGGREDRTLPPQTHGSWGRSNAPLPAVGATPAVLVAAAANFAEEEFYVALLALVLAIFSLLVLLSASQIKVGQPPATLRKGMRARASFLGMSMATLSAIGALLTILGYQDSFYPDTAPSYQGITDATPFLCGDAPPVAPGGVVNPAIDGEEVFRRLLARVEANPLRSTPEYGMLALGTGEARWAKEFHSSLLEEASAQRFTGPTNSIKAVQHEAALRVYYYARMRDAFPKLFSPEEQQRVRSWFAGINRRAMTVEWVDWFYGVAFGKWPEGPYENQDTGAALVAALESEGLAAPELSAANRSYLARNQRGWATGFRNSDDDLAYQPVWLQNALLQSRFSGTTDMQHQSQSFEWFLMQSLPDGAPWGFGRPPSVSPAGTAYMGALILEDPRYVWLADRALGVLEARGEPLFAPLGVEHPIALAGQRPTQGSCLLYGNSGLPTQQGPLAPDKIVLRDGWSSDDAYLALNLRFTGWHRYKATNTISLIYIDGPLAVEQLDAPSSDWLPSGRSLFRDKRIPREKLNGLVIARTGIGADISILTGMGGEWAQDPPFYAHVEHFDTSAVVDVSTTTIVEWHGWQHRRTVALYHDGPIIVVDHAEGPKGVQAAILWHLASAGVSGMNRLAERSGPSQEREGERLTLRDRAHPAELLVLAPSPLEQLQLEVTPRGAERADLRISSRAPASGQLDVLTIFLTDGWIGATAAVATTKDGTVLSITGTDGQIATFRLP